MTTGEPFHVLYDTTVAESFSGKRTSVSKITKITLFSDSLVDSSLGSYKIRITFSGLN